MKHIISKSKKHLYHHTMWQSNQTKPHEKFLESYKNPNLMNLIIASNEQHVINVDVGQRRYMTLDLDNVLCWKLFERFWYKATCQYSGKYGFAGSEQLSGQDRCGGFDSAKTVASAEQVVLSFNSQQKFLHGILYNPEIIAQAKNCDDNESRIWKALM